ncbi:methyltransferase domain-containing protein [Cryobacterium sp. PH31-AA6]|uniref:class I SAM-dependent methyltransferase n=1 Tax=Cryobacterium sp. PH31-AA6 TaxID=3046205 RepID=UPI0024BB9CB3|nr:methyltransferase domain-containing protein [Cryobacterium sp. PH31-AA6]MDJ0323715.1 methyltransferase domain-containing protein [Cryobacterium sp. PH31-AA6]
MDWTAYYDAQAGRAVRSVLLATLRLRGDAEAGVALDMGSGDGVETRHLLSLGWRVHSYDADPVARERLTTGLDPGALSRLSFSSAQFEELTGLPEADFVYAGFSLPFCAPSAFPGLWDAIRSAVKPGGLFAGELFGPHDSWGSRTDMNFHDREQVAGLLAGLGVLSLVEEDREGQSAFGPRHWHVFHVIARNPPAPAWPGAHPEQPPKAEVLSV